MSGNFHSRRYKNFRQYDNAVYIPFYLSPLPMSNSLLLPFLFLCTLPLSLSPFIALTLWSAFWLAVIIFFSPNDDSVGLESLSVSAVNLFYSNSPLHGCFPHHSSTVLSHRLNREAVWGCLCETQCKRKRVVTQQGGNYQTPSAQQIS